MVRQHFPAVDIERFFFVAAHEVDIELCDADFFERVEFFEVGFNRANEAETVDDFIADEIGVVAANFAVVVVIVGALSLYEGCE